VNARTRGDRVALMDRTGEENGDDTAIGVGAWTAGVQARAEAEARAAAEPRVAAEARPSPPSLPNRQPNRPTSPRRPAQRVSSASTDCSSENSTGLASSRSPGKPQATARPIGGG